MGIGDAWGTREELLHPRGKDGRFVKKLAMSPGIVDMVRGILEGFSPRTFPSDGAAGQWAQNRAKPSRFQGGAGVARFSADFDNVQEDLRDGVIDDPSTKKYVSMMDSSSVELPDDVIVTRVVGPDAFGMTPEQMNAPDGQGGIYDLIGSTMADRGYHAAQLGTPQPSGTGNITLYMAVPKGTKAVIPASSPDDRAVILDRDQEFVITKVKPDGRGGYSVSAVATPRTPGETPAPQGVGHMGAGKPKNREAAIRDRKASQQKQMKVPEGGEVAPIGAETIHNPPSPTGPSPQGPGAPAPRTEKVVSESVGGGGGPAPAAPASPTPQTPAAPAAPSAPEAPPAPQPELPVTPVGLKDAVREANLPSPSAGPRRQSWNNAYSGSLSGKKDPVDVLRELDSDIAHFEQNQAAKDPDKKDAALTGDLDALHQLRDVIATHFGLPERVKPKPAPKKAAGGLEARPVGPPRSDADKVPISPGSQSFGRTRKKGEAGGPVERIKPAKVAPVPKLPTAKEREEEDAHREALRDSIASLPDGPLKTQSQKVLDQMDSDASEEAVWRPWIKGSGVTERSLSPKERSDLGVIASDLSADKITRDEAIAALRDNGSARLKKMGDKLAGTPQKRVRKAKTEPVDELDGMLVAELKRVAKEEGIKGYSKLLKDDLKKVIRDKRSGKDKTPDVTPDQVDAQIADAYKALAPESGAVRRVPISDIRERLSELPKEQVDDALKRLGRNGRLMEQENQQNLTQADRDGAIKIGRKTYHFVDLGEGTPAPVKKAAPANAAQAALVPSPGAKKARLSPSSRVTLTPEERRDVTDLSPAEQREYRAFRRQGQDHGDALQSARDKVGVREADKAAAAEKRLAKKATPKKAAPDAAEDEAARRRKLVAESGAQKKRADAIARLDEIVDNGASDRALRHTIDNSGLPDDVKADLLEAADSGDQDQASLRRAIDRARGKDLKPVGKAGESTRFDRKIHKAIGKDLREGRPVRVVRQGHEGTRSDGSTILLDRAVVESDEPAVPAKKASPIAARRQQALDSLREQGIDNPSQMVLEEQMRTLADIEARDLIRRTSGGGTPAKKAAPAATVDGMTAEQHRAAARDILAEDRGRSAAETAERQAEAARHTRTADRMEGKTPAPRKAAAKKAAPAKATPGTPADILAQMQAGGEFPMSREGAAALLANVRKPQLAEMAKTLGIPSSGRMTMADLRKEIVDSAVGRRLDMIATRGFRGDRPDSPEIPDPRGLPDTASRGTERLRRPGDGASARVRDFEAAWKEQGFEFPGSLAKRSTEEIRKDIAAGKITPDEGVRRLESEIEFNKNDLAAMDLALRDLKANPARTPEQERQLIDFTRAAKVARGNIKGQEAASTFLRSHFNSEPVRTKEELDSIKVALPEESKSWLGKATPDDMKETAEKAGLESPKGDTAEEMFDDLLLQTVQKALAERGAAKATKKAAPAKLVRPADAPEGLSVKEIGKGLDLDLIPPKVLEDLQADLDAGKMTPAAIGRKAENWRLGPAGPSYRAAVQTSLDTRTATPAQLREVEAEKARLQAQSDAWKGLADRLKATRRKRAAAPKREPAVLTPKDEAQAADIADLTGVPETKVQAAILDRKEAKAPASEHAKGVADLLGTVGSREEADALLKGKTKPELQDIAKAAGVQGIGSRSTKPEIHAAIVQETVGRRLDSDAIARVALPSSPEGVADPAAEAKKLRDHAEVTRRLAGMRLGNNKPGSFHHNKGLQDQKDADRMEAEADALDPPAAIKEAKQVAAVKAAKKAAPPAPAKKATKKVAAAEAEDKAASGIRLIAQGGFREDKPRVTDSGPLKRNRPELRQDEAAGGFQDRPNADEPLRLGGGQMSGTGNMHADSEMGQLWNDLYQDDRAPNSVLNEIARLATSMSQGDRPFEDVLADLRKLASSSGGQDPVVAKRIQNAIGDIEAPPFEMPKLPDGTPDVLRQLVEDLGKIPTARRRGVMGTSGRNKSVIDDLVDAIGKIDRNEGDHFQNQRELEKHPLHESRDGATQIWRLFDRAGPLGDREKYKAIRLWMRERARAAEAAPKPSGDRPPEAEILRMTIPELRELAQSLGMPDAGDARKDALLEFLLS